MAFTRPTLAALVDRIQQDLVSRLSLSSPILRRSVVYVLARVMAGAAHMLHGHLEHLSRQIFPDQADGDFLARMAGLFGLTRTPAAYSTGNITATGTNGTEIPAGTVLLRADGASYKTSAAVTVAGGIATLPVTATVAGQDSNTDAVVPMTFESPIAGIDSAAVVATGGLAGGADEETDAALSVRLIERMQSPPHGGNATDYVAWAKEIAGVTRAWCYPLEAGEGTVTVRFVRDDDASLIPDAGEVAAVQAYINTVRPVTAAVTVAAPVAVPMDFTIALTPDTAATRAAVEAELEDLLLREAEPAKTILISKIRNAIGDADGVENYVLTTPAADVTHMTGQLATMGTITWA